MPKKGLKFAPSSPARRALTGNHDESSRQLSRYPRTGAALLGARLPAWTSSEATWRSRSPFPHEPWSARRARVPRPARCAASIASAVRRPSRNESASRLRFRSTTSTRCAATPGDDDAPAEDGLSSSFAEELKRRQAVERRSARESAGDDAGGDRWGEPGDAAPRFARDDGARGVETEQLRKSRALQNEGLEGFPRAGELLKLGFTSFISFGPLIAVFSVLFVGTYLLMGSDFIHGGRIAPAAVHARSRRLAEPTVDRAVPRRRGPRADGR